MSLVAVRLSTRGAAATAAVSRRAFTSTSATLEPFLPRITHKRPLEAGPGGRASDAGIKVAIFGACSFLGRYICSDLGTNGVLTYIGNRGDEWELRDIKVGYELGRSRFVFYHYDDMDSMANVIANADVVINAIDLPYEKFRLSDIPTYPYLKYEPNTTFAKAHTLVATRIAQLCLDLQVDHLIHISSAAATPDATSEWAKTKYAGEMAVREIYPWATVVKPTALMGHEDRLLNWFANMTMAWGFVPLVDGGEALSHPVYVDDVARVVGRIIDDPERFEGRTLDCFGPADYTQRELCEFVMDVTGLEPFVLEITKSQAATLSRAMQYMGRPLVFPDWVELVTTDFVPRMTPEEYETQTKGTGRILVMEDVGVTATPMEKIAFDYLHRFRRGGHFRLTSGYH